MKIGGFVDRLVDSARFAVDAKPKLRVASRFLLPLEIFVGLHMMLWGLSALGIPVSGAFHNSLNAAGYHVSIGIAFTALGASMAGVAMFEWCFGRPALCIAPDLVSRIGGAGTWFAFWRGAAFAWWTARCFLIQFRQDVTDVTSTTGGVYILVSMRSTVAFFSMAAWTGGAVLVYMASSLEQVGAFYGISLLNLSFCWWVYIENLKVRYAINPKYPTSNLQFHR